jgi:hypothetical protein
LFAFEERGKSPRVVLERKYQRENLKLAVAKQVQSFLVSPAMEESLEIYRLRLEHKRFVEDAEQERTSKELLREELVAEIHRRADGEKTIRALKDENMILKLKLERLEREREVEVPVGSYFLTNLIML